ncbi:MAG TPA: adenylate/guanylate cyclase domain-containing protein [Acidimicrobiia bacterium]|nr:adenylate/guanylate cyclase domain-containing protein [Acidimicrobiia bacterium]
MLLINRRGSLVSTSDGQYVDVAGLGETKYAESGGVHIAYRAFGDGVRDVVAVFGFISHLDILWESRAPYRFFEQLSRFSRVIMFDKRGMGLSDRLSAPPTLEDTMDDVRAVMDAADSEQAVLFGMSQGVEPSLLFATTYPERTVGLVLYGGMARSIEAPDYPWAAPLDDVLAANVELIAPAWGTGASLDTFAPTVADDPSARDWMAKMERSAASPGMVRQLYLMALDTDVRHLLPTVQAPTLVLHRRGDQAVSVHGSRWMASEIPGARFVELPGVDHSPWWGDTEVMLGEIEEFVTGVRSSPDAERVLATILFTDIVGSTERATAMGDRRWREVLDEHDRIGAQRVELAGGNVVKTTGDGLLALFDGPGRAVRAAQQIRNELAPLDLEIRAGVHTGEIERRGDDVGGLGVHIAARVAAEAGAGEVLVSRTVKDLVAGSGIRFEDRGIYVLKGVPDEWQLFVASSD